MFIHVRKRKKWNVMCLFDTNELDVEGQSAVGRNAGQGLSAVGTGGRDDNTSLTLDGHAGDTDIPTLDDLTGTKLEREGLALGVGVKDVTVQELANVSNGNLVAGLGSGTSTDLTVLDGDTTSNLLSDGALLGGGGRSGTSGTLLELLGESNLLVLRLLLLGLLLGLNGGGGLLLSSSLLVLLLGLLLRSLLGSLLLFLLVIGLDGLDTVAEVELILIRRQIVVVLLFLIVVLIFRVVLIVERMENVVTSEVDGVRTSNLKDDIVRGVDNNVESLLETSLGGESADDSSRNLKALVIRLLLLFGFFLLLLLALLGGLLALLGLLLLLGLLIILILVDGVGKLILIVIVDLLQDSKSGRLVTLGVLGINSGESDSNSAVFDSKLGLTRLELQSVRSDGK